MSTSRSAPILALALVLAIAGCARELAASPEPTRPTRSVPTMPSLPPSDAPITGEVPADIMERILADAADRSGSASDAIEVIRAESVTWNDGSLGCPEPGMLYTQALVEGYHVVLEADDEELDYRLTSDGGFRLCEDGGRPSR